MGVGVKPTTRVMVSSVEWDLGEGLSRVQCIYRILHIG